MTRAIVGLAGARGGFAICGTLLLVGSCRATTPSAAPDAGGADGGALAEDSPAGAGGADATASAPADGAADVARATDVAGISRRLSGDCEPDGGEYALSAIDVDAWLKAHGARLPRDTSCWGAPPGGGPAENLCHCQHELEMPDKGVRFLSCTREHEDPAYGWSTNTVLYALERGALRRVLDVKTGTSGSNFELVVPALVFVPQVRGDAIAFVEPRCRRCAVAMEALDQAEQSKDPTWRKARTDYAKVCALPAREWKWTGHRLVPSAR